MQQEMGTFGLFVFCFFSCDGSSATSVVHWVFFFVVIAFLYNYAALIEGTKDIPFSKISGFMRVKRKRAQWSTFSDSGATQKTGGHIDLCTSHFTYFKKRPKSIKLCFK